MSKPLHILILEDSPVDAELIMDELRSVGFDPQWQRVEIEADYLAGLDTMPDVILADYSLPQFDGLTALKLLRERSLDIPFILITGALGEEIAVEAMKHGAADYLLKDRLARLGAAIERALEQKRLRVQKRVAGEELRRSEAQFRQLNEALELRVTERTTDLQATVKSLEKERAERLRLEREILEISEREQCRLGQDLHDGLGQELAGIAMFAEVVAKQLKNENHPLEGDAGKISECIRSSIYSARRLAMGLYPVELARGGLLLALQDLANRTSQLTGVTCELRQSGPNLALPESAGIHIYRIVQECIANAIKHGKAHRIVIELQAGDGVRAFSVSDNGIGFKNPGGCAGMGLHLMDYRADMIGAEIEVTEPAEGGCRVTCRLKM